MTQGRNENISDIQEEERCFQKAADKAWERYSLEIDKADDIYYETLTQARKKRTASYDAAESRLEKIVGP